MKHNFKNMSGYVFNDCKVIERVESKNKRAMWLCECFCGNRFIESGTRGEKGCGVIIETSQQNYS